MIEKYTIKTHPKFDKEMSKLTDKCSSLESDFERLKKVLLLDLKRGNHRLTQDTYIQISRLGRDIHFPVFKIKKFRCKEIPKGNRSGFRFIFILSRKHHVIYFTECYFKRSNKVENRNRIRKVCLNPEKYFCD
nr:hypothetical protein [uncultured Methanobrevibacter sp.]